ncbi:HAD superfamily phosphatase [Sporodiniella umbellata]|nr:HAD superfamily phosphatase [Sporodiniella umbellata]
MPHIIVKDMSCVNYTKLNKLGGIQVIGFDKDNCLTEPYVATIHPPFENAWKSCKDTFGQENIAQKLESSLGVRVLKHKKKKPDGGSDLSQFIKPVLPENVAFVGDRILTDVLFGNLNGNLTIWASNIITEKGDNKPAAFTVGTPLG